MGKEEPDRQDKHKRIIRGSDSDKSSFAVAQTKHSQIGTKKEVNGIR